MLQASGINAPNPSMFLTPVKKEQGEAQPPKKKHKPRPTCWYYDHGCCSRGRDCTFSHAGAPGKEGYLDLSQAGEPCWFFTKGCCSKGLSCPFPHIQEGADERTPNFQQLLAQQTQAATMASMWDPSNPAAMQAIEERIQIPARMARSIIGPGGENVRLLSQVTGCKVQIDGQIQDGMQMVRLYGMEPQRKQAKALIEQQCEAEQKLKNLKFEEPVNEDGLYTAVKVALNAAGVDQQEEAAELSKIRQKIVSFARSSSEEVDTSGREEPLDGIVRQLSRNFFSGVCSVYYERPWLASVDFQLVLEAAIKELLPQHVLNSVEPQELDEHIWQSHDLAFEEQRFLPIMWEIVRPLIDGPKMKKKVYKAFEVGRLEALVGDDEGSGLSRAESFLQRWVHSCASNMAEEGGGDPEGILEKEKILEVFSALLANASLNGGSNALPARWSAEVGYPEKGWEPILRSALDEVLKELRSSRLGPEVFSKGKGGKSSAGKGKPGKGDMMKGDMYEDMKGGKKGGKGEKGGGPKGAFKGAVQEGMPMPEPASAFVRRRGSYGQY